MNSERSRRVCVHCGDPIDHLRIDANTCTTRCRSRVARRRAAGLPPNSFNTPAGAARGRVSLSIPTRAELRAHWRVRLLEVGLELKHTAC